jgi:hypothetical protein
MTGDPRIEPGWTARPWRDDHPLGVTGLHSLSVAVRDLPAAAGWLADLLGTVPLYRAPRPAIDADAVGIPAAASVVELVQARSADGPVADYIARYGQRLRSIEIGVVGLERARRHLTASGLRVVPGSRPEAIALAEQDNWGVRWEFAEAPAR